MMDKKTFVSIIEALEKQDKRDQEISASINRISPDCSFFYSTSLIDDIADILDAEGYWVSWFCIENDYGRKKLEAGFVGKTRPITSASELYDLIIEVNGTEN